MSRRGGRRRIQGIDPANLFPVKGGQPNPNFVGRVGVANVQTENAKLRANGMLPLRWDGARHMLKEAGVPVEQKNAYVEQYKKDIPGQVAVVGDLGWWAPRWAVLLVEGEPCNDDAREWALAKAMSDPEFKGALEAFATLADGKRAREQMAEFVMAQWEPA